VTTFNSLFQTEITITYVNDSQSKIEAMLEMPNEPHIVISQMTIKVDDR